MRAPRHRPSRPDEFEEPVLTDQPVRTSPVEGLPNWLRRELIVLAVLLVCGFVLMPVLVWLVGQKVLGAYANGGPLRLLGDFFSGLGGGSPVYWTVGFGPYVLIQLIRGFWRFVRPALRAAD
jgi:hypothetical protein